MVLSFVMYFFFQAEDGIRDYKVTGVQTCALPIFAGDLPAFPVEGVAVRVAGGVPEDADVAVLFEAPQLDVVGDVAPHQEIGRASCRERGAVSRGAYRWTDKHERVDSGSTKQSDGW